MKNRIIYILFFYIFSFTTYGQRYFVSNQYVYDMFLMNPADAGSERECYILNGYFQKQWFGVDLAPTYQMLTFQAPLKSNVGSGTYLFNDRNGNNKKLGFQQSFSVEVKLRENRRGTTTLAFGLSAYLEQASVDQSAFTGGAGTDPTINGGVESGMGFNANTGMILRINKFHLGASVTNILPQNNPMYENELEPSLPADIHLHTGYTFKVPDRDLFLEPLVYYRRNSLSNSRMDINVKATMPTPEPDFTIWGVLAYRRTMDYNFGKDLGMATTAGIIYKGFSIGLEYQHGLTSAQKHLGSSFLMVAGYRFCGSDRARRIPCRNRDIDTMMLDNNTPQRKKGFLRFR